MLKTESTGWQIMNCANRGRFKWNQHIEMQNQQVEYDNFQLLHTAADFCETNEWVHKIKCYKHIRPHSWCLKYLVQFLAC